MTTQIEVSFVPDRIQIGTPTFAKEVHLTVVTGELLVTGVGPAMVVQTGDTFIVPTGLTVT